MSGSWHLQAEQNVSSICNQLARDLEEIRSAEGQSEMAGLCTSWSVWWSAWLSSLWWWRRVGVPLHCSAHCTTCSKDSAGGFVEVCKLKCRSRSWGQSRLPGGSIARTGHVSSPGRKQDCSSEAELQLGCSATAEFASAKPKSKAAESAPDEASSSHRSSIFLSRDHTSLLSRLLSSSEHSRLLGVLCSCLRSQQNSLTRFRVCLQIDKAEFLTKEHRAAQGCWAT